MTRIKVPVYDPQNNCADYISAKAHTVIIDKMLLEENQEHRYRFTMGHEAGHEFLHKEYFAYDPDQITLFDLMGENSGTNGSVPCGHKKKMDCRTSKAGQTRDWMEWQANALSSAVLMPVSMVRMVAENFKGPDCSRFFVTMHWLQKLLPYLMYHLKQQGTD